MNNLSQTDFEVAEELGYIKSSWRGEQPLWKAYWLNLTAIPLFLGWMGEVVPDTWVTVIVYLVILLAVYVWALVSVWRCASNTSREIWTLLARGIVIISPFIVILGLIL